MVTEKFEAILADSDGERSISAFLKDHPAIIHKALVKIGDRGHVLHEFPFGSEYRADFVVLSPFSGAWEIHFVELEPAKAELFNQDGSMARRLNKAYAQVSAWKNFIEKNRATVLRDLSRFTRERDLLRIDEDRREPTCLVGWPLYHPSSSLHFYFDIIIGRRGAMAESAIEAKNAIGQHSDFEVATYDRLIGAARHIERFESHLW